MYFAWQKQHKYIGKIIHNWTNRNHTAHLKVHTTDIMYISSEDSWSAAEVLCKMPKFQTLKC
jgi:uncharacterized membrane protein YbaN (DUF454 family)